MKYFNFVFFLLFIFESVTGQVSGSEFCGEGTYFNESTQLCEVSPLVADFDMSGCVDIPDLLEFLVFFGECEFQSEWSCGSPVSFNGYAYSTVQIGDQCWFAENLRSTHFATGDTLATTLGLAGWNQLDIPACQGPGEDFFQCPTCTGGEFELYGRYYNHAAIDDLRNICPVGWHPPTVTQWNDFVAAVGNDIDELRVGEDWSCSEPALNTTGFGARPGSVFGTWIGGSEWVGSSGGDYAMFGTTGSSPWDAAFWIGCNWMGQEGLSPTNAYNVRCVKGVDDDPTGCTDDAFLEYDPEAIFDDGSCATCVHPEMDGYVYQTVLIDGKCWFAENLRTTVYRDGEAIPSAPNNESWTASTSGNADYMAIYGQDEGPCTENVSSADGCDPEVAFSLFGGLYNYYTVSTYKLCPTNYHVPSEAEWLSMKEFVETSTGLPVGQALKSTSGWSPGGNGFEPNGSDAVGFAALPGGNKDSFGEYSSAGVVGWWWTATPIFGPLPFASHFQIASNFDVLTGGGVSRNRGLSVRCVSNDY